MKEVFQQNRSRRWNFATGCGVSAVFCFISSVRIAVCLCLTAWWGICSIFDWIPSCTVHRCFKSTGEPCRGHYNWSQDQYVRNLNLLVLCIFLWFYHSGLMTVQSRIYQASSANDAFHHHIHLIWQRHKNFIRDASLSKTDILYCSFSQRNFMSSLW